MDQTVRKTRPKFRVQRDIDRLPVPEKGHDLYYCENFKGLAIRVTAKSRRNFVFVYRRKKDGEQRRYTFAAYPAWSLERAKKRAEELRRKVDDGGDPLEQKEEVRKAPTVADMCQCYIEEELSKKAPSTQRNYRRIIDKDILPALGRIKVADVRFADVDALHRSISKRTPYGANRTAALLSKMFNLALTKWEWRSPADGNPVRGVERNFEEKRQTYLTPESLGRLMQALDMYPDQRTADIFRLLLLTGARSGEVKNARWDQFDLSEGVWTKPSSETKQKREHRVRLSAPALQILSELYEQTGTGEFVFPGRLGGARDNLKKPWDKIRKAAGLEGVRVHDLRHTYASILASGGMSLPLIGKMLGHSQAATTQRYVHLFDDPLKKAADHVGTVVMGGEIAKGAPLRKR